MCPKWKTLLLHHDKSKNLVKQKKIEHFRIPLTILQNFSWDPFGGAKGIHFTRIQMLVFPFIHLAHFFFNMCIALLYNVQNAVKKFD